MPPPPQPGERPDLAPPPPQAMVGAPSPEAFQAGEHPSVLVQNVSKWFDDVVAVSDVTFAVWPGVTALLGPNGAGKSTMLRMLCGLIAPAQGSISVMGRDPRTDRLASQNIGLVHQEEKLFDEMRALDFVTLMAELQGVPSARQAAREALDVVELNPDDPRSIHAYSKGMRQRVKVAQAIVHNPHVLLLDEPLAGLDPRQRLHMVSLFRRLGAEGRCVIVSSHVLEEVERLGSKVLVIAHGRLAAQGDFHAIRDLMDNRPHRMRIRTSAARAFAGTLLASGTADAVEVKDDETVIAETRDVDLFRRSVASIAVEHQARLFEVDPMDDDLESVFRYLVGR